MVRTARVERRIAGGTGVSAGEIVCDRQFRFAPATPDGALVAGVDWPAFGLVVRTRRVALEAGVVRPAARKPDRDHVPRAVVVGTPRLVVQPDASDRARILRHVPGDSGTRHQRVAKLAEERIETDDMNRTGPLGCPTATDAVARSPDRPPTTRGRSAIGVGRVALDLLHVLALHSVELQNEIRPERGRRGLEARPDLALERPSGGLDRSVGG